MPIVLKRQNGKTIFQYKVGLVAAPGDPIKVLEQGAPWRRRKPGGRTTSTVTGGRASTAAAAVDDDGEECANLDNDDDDEEEEGEGCNVGISETDRL